ncbi:unnamed protein product [Rhizophagus irregularis]|nr:unnamed protein product [Rhizophagus irregularis]
MGKVNRKHFDDNNSQKKRKTLTFNQKKELCEKHRDQNLSVGIKLEFLPDDESNTSDDDDSEIEDDSEDLQLLINRLPITDLLNMEEYINIDDEIITEEELTSEEIVNIVRGQSAVEEHVEEEDETVAASGALNSIEKLIRYVRQNDLGIDNSDMQNLLKLKKKIISDSKKS